MSDPGRYLQSLRKLRDYAAKGCWEAQVRLTFPRKTVFVRSFLCCHCGFRFLPLEAGSKLLNNSYICMCVFNLQAPPLLENTAHLWYNLSKGASFDGLKSLPPNNVCVYVCVQHLSQTKNYWFKSFVMFALCFQQENYGTILYCLSLVLV